MSKVIESPSALKERAIALARSVVAALEEKGVEAWVTGALAEGRFSKGHEIDFLIKKCPRHLIYAIESVVEDHLDGFRFNVIYEDEVPDSRRRFFVDGAVRASQL